MYVTQSFHDNNIIPIYCIHSYDMQSACFRALGANEGKLKKKYMVTDLKVLVRSFNCESRACYVGNPRESFFFEFAKVKFYFAKVSRKLGIIIIICKGLPPTAARGPAGEGHQRMRVAVAKFPKVRLCESQTPRPLVFAFPSVHPLLMAGVCE